MAKAKTPETSRVLPSGGGTSIRDKATGELRPNVPPEQTAKTVEEGK